MKNNKLVIIVKSDNGKYLFVSDINSISSSDIHYKFPMVDLVDINSVFSESVDYLSTLGLNNIDLKTMSYLCSYHLDNPDEVVHFVVATEDLEKDNDFQALLSESKNAFLSKSDFAWHIIGGKIDDVLTLSAMTLIDLY